VKILAEDTDLFVLSRLTSSLLVVHVIERFSSIFHIVASCNLFSRYRRQLGRCLYGTLRCHVVFSSWPTGESSWLSEVNWGSDTGHLSLLDRHVTSGRLTTRRGMILERQMDNLDQQTSYHELCRCTVWDLRTAVAMVTVVISISVTTIWTSRWCFDEDLSYRAERPRDRCHGDSCRDNVNSTSAMAIWTSRWCFKEDLSYRAERSRDRCHGDFPSTHLLAADKDLRHSQIIRGLLLHYDHSGAAKVLQLNWVLPDNCTLYILTQFHVVYIYLVTAGFFRICTWS